MNFSHHGGQSFRIDIQMGELLKIERKRSILRHEQLCFPGQKYHLNIFPDLGLKVEGLSPAKFENVAMRFLTQDIGMCAGFAQRVTGFPWIQAARS